MPELPEVEIVAAGLREGGLAGATITGVSVRWPRSVAAPDARTFRHRLRGRRVVSVSRRGKFIVLTLDGNATLLVHLRMTGHLFFAPRSEPQHGHEHVVLALDDGRELRFRDPRKFGRWWLTASPQEVIGHLGPEPLGTAFTAAFFASRLSSRRGMLKPLLLDQTFLAGLGNIYVDEALWDAGLHPLRRACTLSEAERRRLHGAVRKVLRRGISSMGTTLGNGLTTFRSVWGRRGTNRAQLKVFRRTGLPCPRCHGIIERIVVAQRGTHVCPRCQPARTA